MTDRCHCGGVILADTEDWAVPICCSCYETTDCYKLKALLTIALPLLETYSEGEWKMVADKIKEVLK